MKTYLRGGIARRAGSPRPRRTVLAPRIQVTLLSNTSALVEWQFTDSVDADSIIIERSDDDITYTEVVTQASGSSGSYTDTGLTSDTCYWWRARGRIPYGVGKSLISANSNIEIKTTTDTTPALVQPTSLAVSTITLVEATHTIGASWTAVPNADGYFWWIVAGGDGGFSTADTDDPNVTTGTSLIVAIPRLSGDDVCELHVLAVNGSGRGPEAVLQFVVPGNLKAPNLLPLSVSGNDVSISYVEDPGARAAVEYRIERDSGDGFAVVATIAAGVAAPQYEDANLTDDVYHYRVLAVDNDQLDDDGNVVEFLSAYSIIRTAEINASGVVDPDLGIDFEAAGSLAPILAAGFSILTPNNILYDNGTTLSDGSPSPMGEAGLVYRYIERSDHCADQALFMEIDTPSQMEVWTEQVAIFSTNFSTVNENCSTIPNMKLQIGHMVPAASMLTGRPRFEVQMGQGVEGRNMGATGTGYPTLAAEAELINPNAFLTPSPVDATTLWDGERHVIRTYWRLFFEDGVWKGTMIMSVDGQVTHKWTALAGNPGSAKLAKLTLGGARSTGASEEMYVCQKEYWIWNAGNDPGWFTGITPTDYT